jgi:fused signal recognition particle receptor
MDASVIVVGLVVAFLVGLIVMAAVNTVRRRKERYEAPPPPEKPEIPAKKPAEEARKPGKPKKKKPEKAPEKPPEKPVWKLELPEPKPLTEGLERTRHEGLLARLKDAVSGGKKGEEVLEAVEEALITADCGVKTAMEMVEELRNTLAEDELADSTKVLDALKQKMAEVLSAHDGGFLSPLPEQKPAVIMVVGVNGTGKTTTIGKLAMKYKSEGLKVLLAAGDTFRAAGATQLAKWAEKVDVPVVEGPDKADPASVIFDAIKKAQNEGFDLVIADTAGRLHTDVNLVDELRKVHRVIGKAQPGAPHECLLVLDAGMGQNSIRQAEEFKKAVNVTSIAVTKLDGTAKGGVVFAIVRDLGIPVRFIGIGEGVSDLRPFQAAPFVEALFTDK